MYWLFFYALVIMYIWRALIGLSTRMSLLGRRWTDRLVCRRWADVGPTAWFADVEPTLDRPLGLPTLSRRWTAGQNYVGPPANVASGPTEWSTAVQRRTNSDVLSGYGRDKNNGIKIQGQGRSLAKRSEMGTPPIHVDCSLDLFQYLTVWWLLMGCY